MTVRPASALSIILVLLLCALTTAAAGDRWQWNGHAATLQPTQQQQPPPTVELKYRAAAHTVEWSRPLVGGPALRFTLFAHWTASAAAESARALPLQHDVRTRICEVTTSTDPTASELLECAVHLLPRGVPVTLTMLTQCQAEGCAPSLSSPLVVTLEAAVPAPQVVLQSLGVEPAIAAAPTVALSALLGDIDRVQNDTQVRVDLGNFFDAANGPSWTVSTNWKMPEISLCDWLGITCNARRDTILGFALPGNNIISDPTGSAAFSAAFDHIHTLELLNVAFNPTFCVDSVDLTGLSSLKQFLASSMGSDISCVSTTNFNVDSRLALPPVTQLEILDLTGSNLFILDPVTVSYPRLQVLNMFDTPSTFPLAVLPTLSQLTHLNCSSLESTTPDAQGRSGAALTHAWFSGITKTNPLLQMLDLSGSTEIDFGSSVPSNWPLIDLPLLSELVLQGVSGLRTTVAGPPADWLKVLPSLASLTLGSLPSVYIDTAAFTRATTIRLTTLTISSTAIKGDLVPLLGFQNLTDILLVDTGLASELPLDIAQHWPNLRSFCIEQASLFGSVPHFAHLPQLQTLRLSANNLAGTLPSNFLSGSMDRLEILSLQRNRLRGNMALLDLTIAPLLRTILVNDNELSGQPFDAPTLYPMLSEIELQSNLFTGHIPSDFWEKRPVLTSVYLSRNNFTGSIPDSPDVRFLNTLDLSTNPHLGGQLPRNVSASVYDLSYTSVSGPVLSIPFDPHTKLPGRYNFAFTKLTCPILIDYQKGLQSLDLQSAGFSGCDFNNPAQVSLPWDQLLQLDISNNAWEQPFVFVLPARLQVLHATNASIRTLDMSAFGYNWHPPRVSTLLTLDLSGNPLDPGLASNLANFLPWASKLSVFSCERCGLDGLIGTFLEAVGIDGANNFRKGSLFELHLANNSFHGEIPNIFSGYSVAAALEVLPLSLRTVDLSHNPGITGALPIAYAGYTQLTSIDFSSTSLSGELPPSWTALVSLQRLDVHNTSLSCDMETTPGECVLPPWLSLSGVTAPSNLTVGAHCPALIIRGNPYSLLTVDEEYYRQSFCTCDAKYFGKNGVCLACPADCTCVGDVITNCFPVVVPITTHTESAEPVMSFTVETILTCPLTVTGASLCNPDSLAWADFEESARNQYTRANSPYLTASDVQPVASVDTFCYAGHTSRVCSKCSKGYFASGRWCLACSSKSLHVLVVIAYFFILSVICIVTYVLLPTTRTSITAMRMYVQDGLAREAAQTAAAQAENKSRATREAPAPATVDEPAEVSAGQLHLHVESDAPSHAAAASSPPQLPPKPLPLLTVRITRHVRPASGSLLKLLIFHCQQLSLLLQTATSQPPLLTSMLNAISSVGSGFSLASLLAMECLSDAWGVVHQCWMGLAAPGAVITLVTLIYLYQTKCSSSTRQSFAVHAVRAAGHEDGEAEPDDIDGKRMLETKIAGASRIPRIYGMCLSLLYFFVFPCAQTALAALACTDTREYGKGTSLLYLNLHPWLACNRDWATTILPPALIGVFLWFVVFPIVTTVLVRYLHRRLSTIMDPGVWPLCADLLTPYERPYWYYEQVLLLRRLSLVACVSLIPSDSLYLPLALFTIIQVSALGQHAMQPYASVWLNRAELASLYLLLINYITALVLHQAGNGVVDGHSLDSWTVALFALNMIFVLLVLVRLYRSMKPAMLKSARHARTCLERFCCLCCMRPLGDEDEQEAPIESSKLGHSGYQRAHQHEVDDPTAADSSQVSQDHSRVRLHTILSTPPLEESTHARSIQRGSLQHESTLLLDEPQQPAQW